MICEPASQAEAPGEAGSSPSCLSRLLLPSHRLLLRPCQASSAAPALAMVAGMLMPLEQLHSIYELLFRDGVMVAQKDRRPHSYHSQLPGISHLQVQRAMGSLRSRGLVRETFAWRHSYWYLTDEGIAHLRQCLRLPPEIVPATLQRVRHPVAVARPASRLPRAQTVPGPPSCPPKPQELSRQVYRWKEESASPAGHVGPVAMRTAPQVASGARPVTAEGQTPSNRGWGEGGSGGGMGEACPRGAAQGLPGGDLAQEPSGLRWIASGQAIARIASASFRQAVGSRLCSSLPS